MTDAEVDAANLLRNIREAVDGDSVPRKNVALRVAHNEIKRLAAAPDPPIAQASAPEVVGVDAGCDSYADENQRLSDRIERLEAALAKIDAIRNSIIGAQTINWSEHIYPLVAALNEAGFEGLPYPEARQNVGTLIEHNERLEAALREFVDFGPSAIALEQARTALSDLPTSSE